MVKGISDTITIRTISEKTMEATNSSGDVYYVASYSIDLYSRGIMNAVITAT